MNCNCLKIIVFLYATVFVGSKVGLATEIQTISESADSFDWKPAIGMHIRHSGEDSIKIVGLQEGDWNYAQATLNLDSLKPGRRYILRGFLRVEEIEKDEYPPWLKIGMNDIAGKELSQQVTTPYDLSMLNVWQHFVCRFKLEKEISRAYLAVEKGTNCSNSITLYIKDVTIEQLHYGFVLSTEASEELAKLSESRPRLYLDKNDINRLKSSLYKPPYLRFWKAAKQKADRYVRENPPAKLPDSDGNIRPFGKKLPVLALAYLLTDDSEYLKATKKWMDALCSYPNWAQNNDLGPSHILRGMCVVYDWLYDYFSPAERERYRTKIARHVAILHELLENQNIWWARDYLHNHNYVDAGAIGIAGLALYGEKHEALDWIIAAETNFRKVLEVLPPDGAWYEGVGYWSYAMEALLRYFVAMEPIFGMERIKKHFFFRNATRFRLHMSTPGFEHIIPYSDSADFDWYGPGYILRKLAGLYSDSTAQWLANKIEEAREYKELFDWQSWLDLLWYDPNVKAQLPDSLPTWAHFSDLGLFVRRSDWSASGSLTFFKAGSPQGSQAEAMDLFVSGHAHPDQGTFLFWKDGDWVIGDDGYVLKKMTRNQNVLIFNDIGQLGEGGIWFDEKSEIKRFKGTAKIEKITSNERFSFVTANLSKIIHPKAGVKTWKRTISIYENYFIIVRDEVEMKNRGYISSFIHIENGNIYQDKCHFIYSRNRNDVNIVLHSKIDLKCEVLKGFRINNSEEEICVNAEVKNFKRNILFTIIVPGKKTSLRYEFLDRIIYNRMSLNIDDVCFVIDFERHEVN